MSESTTTPAGSTAALGELPPLARRWFTDTFAAPTLVQTQGWAAIASGRDTLIAAPTGSGKTLAAFLWAIGGIAEKSAAGLLADQVEVIYVSPLKALGNDIEKNLRAPLAGMRAIAADRGIALSEIRIGVRSGDTSVRDRQIHLRRPPHILITTPESLYILLTAARSRQILRGARTVIVDEIHAVAPNKRGSHLAISLERLDHLSGHRLQRIGLSATQRPIVEVARFLVGTAHCTDDGTPNCRIIDAGHRREVDLRIETTGQELGAIATHELRAEIFDRMAALIATHRATIVFADTRRMVERIAHELSERLGKDRVAAHHGSLSRATRLDAEQRLKSGAIPVIVASASLELGIDIGHVDLVCQLGAPRSLATLLQRIGRSGHCLGARPRGRIFPTTRDELVQSAAAVRAALAGELDALTIPQAPRDILAQQLVAHVAGGETSIEDAWQLVRGAHPYRLLRRADFDATIDILADGVSTRRGRRSAHLHRDRVNGVLRPRRGARLAAITSGGAIADVADYEVVDDATETRIGSVNEDFAVESMAGDVFLLGNHSWKIRRVEAGRIRVIDAGATPPTIPFWLGEAPARSTELSAAVAALRGEVADRLRRSEDPVGWLIDQCAVDRAGAEQIADYIGATLHTLGAVPTLDTLIAERFFDEAGGMQLVLHSPYGGRINRALGLALRKRFCVTFDFELQAAATDDGVVLSLGEQHSFSLDAVFSMLHPETFEADLVQAALVSPMFTNRWRWNASRALALLRFSGGRRVAMPIQRMRAEDLLAAVFPAQLACGDNRSGPIEVPAHPLVDETIDNCLHEAMDAQGLRQLLESIADGSVRTVAVETPSPSPMSHEILNANPYAFLDDAPLEERRARAVALRRTDPDLSAGIGALSATAIAAVRGNAWPTVRDADEAHDALLSLVAIAHDDALPWVDYMAILRAGGRAFAFQSAAERPLMYAATEHCATIRAIWPAALQPAALWPAALQPAALQPAAAMPAAAPPTAPPPARTQACYELVRGWLEHIGPTTAAALATRLDLDAEAVGAALARLESDGVVLRGSYTPGCSSGDEYCERGLLARIHRQTLGRLRREIEPVSPAELMRFLFRWQHVEPSTRLHGRAGVAEVIAQLDGVELPAHAWEESILPGRVTGYDPAFLDELCLSGETTWGRLAPAPAAASASATPRPARVPHRAALLAFFRRSEAEFLLHPLPAGDDWQSLLSPLGRRILDDLENRGASFAADLARSLAATQDDIEAALWELVTAGLVSGDGVAGLRRLIDRARRTRPRHLHSIPTPRRRHTTRPRRATPAGRWSILRARLPEVSEDELAERAAWRLLRRYGVVLRELSARERCRVPWRSVLRALRRLEAQGLVRGGRFVNGFPGEQFALPDAVVALRALRRVADADDIVIAAADPLNLTSIITPGERIPSSAATQIVYRSGVPVVAPDSSGARTVPRF